MVRSSILVLMLVSLIAAGCSNSSSSSGTTAGEDNSDTETTESSRADDVDRSIERFGPGPETPEGDLESEVQAAAEALFARVEGRDAYTDEDKQNLATISTSGDPRLAWLLSDMLRLTGDPGVVADITVGIDELVGLELRDFESRWGELTDHLIAWDIPAPPNYLEYKRNLYIRVVPEWETLFEDGREVDWRYVSWGGVGIDNRPYDQTDEGCSCIPAIDNPEVTSADDAGWLLDETVVFGVEIDGEARAYPRSIMEVREMVNDSLGGRDFAMPYCTLCGSAQVYFTDELPDGIERPVLRTSGLLIRSNKVMYDIETGSVFDTFLGTAVTGPLADKGLVLEQHTVVTTTWAEWKAEHPDTTVLSEDLGFGRDPDFRNGRDANGPIFPIGDLDQRLGVHDDVVGVITETGTAVAFGVSAVEQALADGETVEQDGVEIRSESGGLVAYQSGTDDIVVSHQAFWFAWSQFYPDTELWSN